MEENFNVHLGKKLRMRRLSLGLTQTKVAQAINVTFQQIQKYEKGTNGVSSSRLMQLSQFLKVPITYFYEDFKDFKEGDTAYTGGEAGLLMPEYKGTQFKAATYGVGTSKIDEFFGRTGEDTDTARLEKQMNVGFDAKPATGPAASTGSFGSVDR